MATYFGEVLPVFSRAVDEEDDLENEFQDTDALNKRDVILRWSPETRKELTETNGFLRHNHFIFVVGCIPIAFIRRFVLTPKAKPIGVISCGLDTTDKNTFSQDTLHDTSCFLYEISLSDGGAVLICTWNLKANPFQEVLATDQLFRNVRTETEVTVLSSSHTINYKQESVDGSYNNAFVKSLVTDSNRRTLPFPKLEAPNFVTGISAAVMSHCQVHGLFASLYVCYSEDGLRSYSETVDVFRALLNAIPFDKLGRITTDSEEKPSRTIRQLSDTNLYI